MRPIATYATYDETTSLCEQCLRLVPTRVLFANKHVFYQKTCGEHGEQLTLVSTDQEYYLRARAAIRQPARPQQLATTVTNGCPYDCGLCKEHDQHTAMGIIEVTDDCNLRCPTCIAGSFPGAGNYKSLATIERMLDSLVAAEGRADLLMISGGEPTIHPEILPILDLAKSKAIDHVMLITNGTKIAEDDGFAAELAARSIEVYLQFDSLNPAVLVNIRGEDLSDVRRKALSHLAAHNVPTTLICVVKKNVNTGELNELVEHALRYPCVRGITFQPVKMAGRNETFLSENYITLSEVRTTLLEGNRIADLWPHPCNPENISIAYLQREGPELSDVSAQLFDAPWEHSREFSTMMYFLPRLDTERFAYHRLFRITIVSFLDQFNFCTRNVKNSCIHFVTSQGKLIPLEAYYLLYSNDGSPRAASRVAVTHEHKTT
ncbi:MAG: radical SAM protein [Thermoanaerobaculia bacterium]